MISDWDEVLMGNKSLTFYKVYAKKNPNSTFAQFSKTIEKKVPLLTRVMAIMNIERVSKK